MKIRLLPLSLLFWLALFLFDGSLYVALSLLASFLHEAGHLTVMRRAGVKPEVITVYPFGLDIRTAPHITSYRTDFRILSAGILANLLASGLCAAALLVLAGQLSDALRESIAFFLGANLALALINALPHPVLDGGGMLRAVLLARVRQDIAERICRIACDLVMIPMLGAVLYLLFYGEGNPTLYLLAAYLILTLVKDRKNGSR